MFEKEWRASALQLFVMGASGLGVSFRITTPNSRLHLGGILVNRTTDYGTERNRKNRFELVLGFAFAFESLSRGFAFGVLDLVRVLSFG